MARKPSQRNHLRSLLDDLEPDLREAFMDSIQGITSEVDLKQIVERIEAHDIEGAIRATNVDPAAYRAFQKAIGDVFEAGGNEAGKKVPRVSTSNGSTALFRFDIEHPTAATDLRYHSSNLITGIVEDQKQSIRTMLADGISAGRSPRRTALDIVGRINRSTGRREGGVIGLTSQQVTFVENMRRRLQSGDKAELEKVLSMGRRDKRFDRTILKAMEEGRPVSAEYIQRMTSRYADSLLLLRGETIARTETMTAFNKGQMAAMQQAINEGRVNESVVVKVWHAFLDDRTRDSHINLNGKEIGFREKFKTIWGNELLHPGDPQGGAREIVNCRCWMETKIDFLADID